MAISEKERQARLQLAFEHIRLVENGHDLERVMDTFGKEPFLVVDGERYAGRESVRVLTWASCGASYRGQRPDGICSWTTSAAR